MRIKNHRQLSTRPCAGFRVGGRGVDEMTHITDIDVFQINKQINEKKF